MAVLTVYKNTGCFAVECRAVIVHTEGLMYVTTLKEIYYTNISFEFTLPGSEINILIGALTGDQV